ncbi:Flp pilus assembly protein CpaB [uncultured Thiodictyon sp.]|jgi:pilus assembly protein CpaB|uniref:Flp pilus assembly protein CpaB n=1 Tax=uncultured Thiodictyon sp. TaxID=1846217 RepID=UPI0025D80C98|nr:Flp pilus assembly protein CpaB [uncultured Thiodictyon sp.]
MTLRSVLLLLVALALAWVAYFAANRWMASRMATGGGADLSRVVAAATDIPNEAKIDASMIKMVDVPAALIPEKAFRDEKAVIGRFADHAIGRGTYLVEGLVVERLGGNTLAAKLTQGKRAVAVRSNDVVGVAGFLVSGSEVDLLVTQGKDTRTMLRDLKVLAVNQTASPDKTDPTIASVVTLEVDPAQAEQIVNATRDGSVQFTLRKPGEGNALEPVAPAGTAATTIKPAAPPPLDRSRTVAVIRGNQLGEITWEPLQSLFKTAPEGQEPTGELR